MNILFWNVNKKALDQCLIELITERNCDLVVLAEYPNEIGGLCCRLNLDAKEEFILVPNFGGCDRIKALIKISIMWRVYLSNLDIRLLKYKHHIIN
jgi:hypothetical protein|uniref:hypothetical protein n=1 Tax=Clostridium sp. 12(A) TaxID=1163671 RepID=UPI00046658E0|nr:hypothetical protein [Clostridium sp. 12(A)]